MGDLLDLARKDWQEITTSGGFESEFTLTSPNSDVATIKGLVTHISASFDFDSGAYVNAPKVRATFSEQVLIDVGYPVRNVNNKVNLLNHIFEYIDSTGVSKKFKVDTSLPDQTVGIITIQVSEYNG